MKIDGFEVLAATRSGFDDKLAYVENWREASIYLKIVATNETIGIQYDTSVCIFVINLVLSLPLPSELLLNISVCYFLWKLNYQISKQTKRLN